MKFMYQYPEPVGTDRALGEAGSITDVARHVEAVGFDGMAFTEHPGPGANWLSAGGHQTLDPFVALGAVAAVTERVRLLTYLAVMPYRNPIVLAKAAASVDVISGGRMVLGVGTGYLKSEFRAVGVDFTERNTLFDEALDVLPMHWSGEPFTYNGTHFNARDVLALPAPVQQPIPIWIGGNAAITLRRVAERAQGWMPLLGPPEMASTTRTPHVSSPADLAPKVEHLRELAGDRADQIEILVPYLDPTIAQPSDDIERHRDAMGRFVEAGATGIAIVGPETVGSETGDFLDAFADAYIEG